MKMVIWYTKQNTDPTAVSAREKWFEREKELSLWRLEEMHKGMDMLRENFPALWN